jgi:hypothetical protein
MIDKLSALDRPLFEDDSGEKPTPHLKSIRSKALIDESPQKHWLLDIWFDGRAQVLWDV